MQLNEFFFSQRNVTFRLVDTFTRNEISQDADRVAKWIALCAHDSTPGPETSPYASLDALFRASKMHVRVYTV